MLRAILYIAVAGVVIYGAVWLIMSARDRGNGGSPARRPQPLAPDDEPAFLAEIDRKIRRERQRREAEAQAQKAAADAAQSEPGSGQDQRGATPSDEDPSTDGDQPRPEAPAP